jgi:hypothetical protein
MCRLPFTDVSEKRGICIFRFKQSNLEHLLINDLSQNVIRPTSITLRSNFQKETVTEVP